MVKPKGMWLLPEPEDHEAAQTREAKLAVLMGGLLMAVGAVFTVFGLFYQASMQLLHR